ncbi:MAG TPA: family 16 glycosylhydrolase [Salinivirgaceae bacterium]|nr:family 16 glycosylhydrolase [Salinivirgaceae bacterium]
MVNLLFKRLFGQIPSTEKFVKKINSLREEMKQHQSFAQGNKLKRYQALKDLVNSTDFQTNKQKIQKLGYKGSPEYQLEKQYQAQKKDRQIAIYLEVEQGADLKRLEAISNSDDFFKYSELKKVIESGEIDQIKKEMEQNYQQEYALDLRLKKLVSGRNLKKYLKITQSAEYQTFERLGNSSKVLQYQIVCQELETTPNEETQQTYHDLKNDPEIKLYQRYQKKGFTQFIQKVESTNEYAEYISLKEYTESEIHKQKLQEYTFENSEVSKVLKMFEEIKKLPDIKFYLTFTNSKEYKTYQSLLGSQQIKDFKALESQIQSAEFIERKSYLQDPQKWEKTEEFQLEREYLTLQNDPEIKWYFDCIKKNKFAEELKWETIFEEQFETLDTTKWLTIPFQGHQNLNNRSYVPEGNRQFHTEGKNVYIEDHKLRIETRKEKTTGLRWQTSSGFKIRDFDYTSGIVNTGHFFRMNKGKVEIVAQMENPEEIVHAAFLKAELIAPHIDIFCTGSHKGFKVRFFKENSDKATFEESFKGINPEEPFHYTFLWEDNHMEWQLNGYTIAKYSGETPTKNLYIGISSVLLKEPINLPANFIVHSIKVFVPQKH